MQAALSLLNVGSLSQAPGINPACWLGGQTANGSVAHDGAKTSLEVQLWPLALLASSAGSAKDAIITA